jgi:hypothetical protein
MNAISCYLAKRVATTGDTLWQTSTESYPLLGALCPRLPENLAMAAYSTLAYPVKSALCAIFELYISGLHLHLLAYGLDALMYDIYSIELGTHCEITHYCE